MKKNIITQYKKIIESRKLKLQASDFTDERFLTTEESLEKLNKVYQKGNELVLVLGAGISIEFGIPDWVKLLQELLLDSLEDNPSDTNSYAKVLNKVFNPSIVTISRYVEEYYKKNGKYGFERQVRKIIYSQIDKTHKSDLINRILAFIFAVNKRPQINSILTYNYDDILEDKITEFDSLNENPTISIFGKEKSLKNKLPIFHIHGFLPDTSDRIDHNIILGETTYHREYVDIYKWSNLIQLEKFRNNTCLFIGSSLTDPNTRRLLDIAFQQKNKVKHYQIRKKTSSVKTTDVEILKLINDDNIDLSNFLQFYNSFIEQDAHSLGVNTIWVENYSNIPTILDEILKQDSD